jgi:hypothetical protein
MNDIISDPINTITNMDNARQDNNNDKNSFKNETSYKTENINKINKLRSLLEEVDNLIKINSPENSIFINAILDDINDTTSKIELYLTLFKIISLNNQLPNEKDYLNQFVEQNAIFTTLNNINNDELKHANFISSILPIIFILKNIYDKLNS